MSNVQLLKKLSARDILGSVVSVVSEMEIGDRKDAYAVAGICEGYETGTSTYGEWTRFCGDLQGVNYITGEIFRAPKAHVPDVLEMLILDGVKENSEVIGSKCTKNTQYYRLDNSLEFSFKVAIERLDNDESGAVKYRYIPQPMIDIAPNNAIAHLIQHILPGPSGTLEQAPKAKKGKK